MDGDCQLGDGVGVCRDWAVDSDCRLGDGVGICRDWAVDGDCRLGDGVGVGRDSGVGESGGGWSGKGGLTLACCSD